MSKSKETTTCSRVLLEKLAVAQVAKIFPPFYGNRRLKNRVQKYPPLAPILSQINPVHFLSPIYLISILLFSSNISTGLPN
jgi:hypothetical protein